MMQPEALSQAIGQDIRTVVHADRIELYIPFFFGGTDDAPLCLTWDRDGILSDGGRTVAELKKRLGNDLTPWEENIRHVLHHSAAVLVGGQKLEVTPSCSRSPNGESYKDFLRAYRYMLEVMSLLSIIDTITVDTDGTVVV